MSDKSTSKERVLRARLQILVGQRLAGQAVNERDLPRRRNTRQCDR